MKTPGRYASQYMRQPRGSLLVFAVIVIAVLAMIATTMMLVLGQSTRLSTNVVGRIENDFAAKSGLDHATRALRDTMMTYMVYTDKGVLRYNTSASHPWFQENQIGVVVAPIGAERKDSYDPVFSSAPYVTPWRQFAEDPTAPATGPEPAAKLSDYVTPEVLRYTTSPLYTNAAAFASGDPERALFNEIQGTTSEFYKHTDNVHAAKMKAKVLERISSVRGRYWVWISDLDSKLYIHARDGAERIGWGIDTTLTGDLSLTPPPTEDEVIEEIFNQIELQGILAPELISGVTPGVGGLKDLAVAPIPANDQRQRHFTSMDEASTRLEILHPPPTETDPDKQAAELADPGRLDENTYAELRAQLGVYFTVYRDAANTTTSQKQVKPHSTALNINTAPVELIAAALSQIPARDVSDQFTIKTLSTLEDAGREDLHIKLAQRIVALRPFLCRMDFEDFLAAHIMGSALDEEDPGDLNTPPEDDIANDPSFVRMIYYAMQRRWGPGYTPNAEILVTPANVANDDKAYYATPELSLARYLEIPGLPNNAPQFMVEISGTPSWPNEPRYQMERFKFFFESTLGLSRNECLITPFEFNNIINSISTSKDDIQVVPFGQTVAVQQPIILPGSDGVLQTVPLGDDTFISRIFPGADTVLQSVPQGDDLIVGGAIEPGLNGVLDTVADPLDDERQDTTTIWPGPNRLVETQVGQTQPSYYSYIDDLLFAENLWYDVDDKLLEHANSAPTPPPEFFTANHLLHANVKDVPFSATETMAQADRRAASVMRFYYRLPLIAGTATPQLPTYPNGRPPQTGSSDLGHLVSWRCAPGGDSVRLTGFYQMAFDDWSFSLGPLQAMGDYFYYTDGIEDFEDFTYSAARPWSGRAIPYMTYDVDYSGAIDQPNETNVGPGDVSWGPKFGFRSRFFGIYVLGQGDYQWQNGPETSPADPALRDKLKAQGQRRIEAVYDALLDQILWQRAPVTDKRVMGEPLPPPP